MYRSRIWLVLWILVILFPMAWLGRFSPVFERTFAVTFAPEWMHVLTHAVLYAGLAGLLVYDLRSTPNRKTVLLVILAVLAVGVGQEGLQAFSMDQTFGWGSIFDLGVDFAGGLLGYGLARTKSKAFLASG